MERYRLSFVFSTDAGMFTFFFPQPVQPARCRHRQAYTKDQGQRYIAFGQVMSLIDIAECSV